MRVYIFVCMSMSYLSPVRCTDNQPHTHTTHTPDPLAHILKPTTHTYTHTSKQGPRLPRPRRGAGRRRCAQRQVGRARPGERQVSGDPVAVALLCVSFVCPPSSCTYVLVETNERTPSHHHITPPSTGSRTASGSSGTTRTSALRPTGTRSTSTPRPPSRFVGWWSDRVEWIVSGSLDAPHYQTCTTTPKTNAQNKTNETGHAGAVGHRLRGGRGARGARHRQGVRKNSLETRIYPCVCLMLFFCPLFRGASAHTCVWLALCC